MYSKEEMIDNLESCGCDEKTISDFISCSDQKKAQLLNRQRRMLLEGLHSYQKKIDCLDYMRWQMRKEYNDEI